jgi:hypothetical protein
VQFYDPYNYPAITIYEDDGCTGSSSTFGVRTFNFTLNSTGGTEVIKLDNNYWPNIVYPALNGNSAVIPFMTVLTAYDSNGNEVFYFNNTC